MTEVYNRAGRGKPAEAIADEAWSQAQAMFPPGDPRRTRACLQVGEAWRQAGRLDEARDRGEEAKQLLRSEETSADADALLTRAAADRAKVGL